MLGTGLARTTLVGLRFLCTTSTQPLTFSSRVWVICPFSIARTHFPSASATYQIIGFGIKTPLSF